MKSSQDVNFLAGHQKISVNFYLTTQGLSSQSHTTAFYLLTKDLYISQVRAPTGVHLPSVPIATTGEQPL